jgi:hypothetical protein
MDQAWTLPQGGEALRHRLERTRVLARVQHPGQPVCVADEALQHASRVSIIDVRIADARPCLSCAS